MADNSRRKKHFRLKNQFPVADMEHITTQSEVTRRERVMIARLKQLSHTSRRLMENDIATIDFNTFAQAIPVVVPTIPNYTALLADTSLQIPGAIAYVNSILDDPNTPADTWGLYIFIVVDSFNYMSADPPVPPDEFYIAGDVSGRAIRGGGPVQQQGEWQLINSGTP